MRYAIVINIDYVSNDDDTCGRLWLALRQRMIEYGFRLEGRVFTIDSSQEDACQVARDIIEIVGAEMSEIDDIYTYLKEFFGYDSTETVNLLLPPAAAILLEDE